MGIIFNAVQSIFSIIIMISLGFLLTSKKWFDGSTSKLFVKLVTNISLPCLMVSSLLTSFEKDQLLHSGKGLFIPFASMAFCYVAGILVAKLVKIEDKHKGVFQTMFFVSNTIFIGLPVNLALFGEKSIPYVLLYYIANTTFFWTIGVYTIRRDGNVEKQKLVHISSLKKIFSPPLTSFLFSIALILLNVKLPLFVMDTCKYLGNLTTPLSMLFIGITIHSISFRDVKLNKDLVALFFGRFVVSPLSIVVLAMILPIPVLMKKVFVMQAAMPVMTQTAIIAKSYKADHHYVALMITTTTIASIIFIPLYMYLLK